MPYDTTSDLPAPVQKLPKSAQEVYRSAFNSALAQYGDEGTAAQVAWAAVKRGYMKKGNQWVAKGKKS